MCALEADKISRFARGGIETNAFTGIDTWCVWGKRARPVMV